MSIPTSLQTSLLNTSLPRLNPYNSSPSPSKEVVIESVKLLSEGPFAIWVGFGARGAAIKSGALTGQLLMQYFVARRSPRLAKVLSFVNFAGAGVLTGVAVRNYGVPQPARFAGR